MFCNAIFPNEIVKIKCQIVRMIVTFTNRPKFDFGFGYRAESGDIFSFGYGRNRETRFRPTFGYGRNYDKVSA